MNWDASEWTRDSITCRLDAKMKCTFGQMRIFLADFRVVVCETATRLSIHTIHVLCKNSPRFTSASYSIFQIWSNWKFLIDFYFNFTKHNVWRTACGVENWYKSIFSFDSFLSQPIWSFALAVTHLYSYASQRFTTFMRRTYTWPIASVNPVVFP